MIMYQFTIVSESLMNKDSVWLFDKSVRLRISWTHAHSFADNLKVK